jgi:hypothetical protein
MSTAVRRRPVCYFLASAAVFFVSGFSLYALGHDDDDDGVHRILPIGSQVEDRGYDEWSAAGWQWATAFAQNVDPVLDGTGAFAGRGQRGLSRFTPGFAPQLSRFHTLTKWLAWQSEGAASPSLDPNYARDRGMGDSVSLRERSAHRRRIGSPVRHLLDSHKRLVTWTLLNTGLSDGERSGLTSKNILLNPRVCTPARSCVSPLVASPAKMRFSSFISEWPGFSLVADQRRTPCGRSVSHGWERQPFGN